MDISIRKYRESDYPVIRAWWEVSGETPPLPSMMPLDSSFIVEIDGTPSLSVCLYLSNQKQACIAENFVGNPGMKGTARRKASEVMVSFLERFAKEQGYASLYCIAYKEKVKRRYKELGFKETLSGVSCFIKELK